MFQPTHPKRRAEKSIMAIARELYEQREILERAEHSIAFLEARRARLIRYVQNYDEAENQLRVSPLLRQNGDIPQAF